MKNWKPRLMWPRTVPELVAAVALAVGAWLLVGLVATAIAQAGWRINRATATALQVFPEAAEKCPDRIAALFSGDEPVGHDRAGAWTTGDCAVTFTTRRSWRDAYEPFCTLFIHEVGHIAGYMDPSNPAEPWHSADPGHIMSAELFFTRDVAISRGRRLVTWYGTDWRCRDRSRAFLGLERPAVARRGERVRGSDVI